MKMKAKPDQRHPFESVIAQRHSSHVEPITVPLKSPLRQQHFSGSVSVCPKTAAVAVGSSTFWDVML